MLNVPIGEAQIDKVNLVIQPADVPPAAPGCVVFYLKGTALWAQNEAGQQRAVLQLLPGNHVADATGTLADVVAKFNTLLARVEAAGILKTS